MGFNIYVTRKIPQPGLDLLFNECKHVEINPEDRALAKAELVEKVKGRDGILCLLTDVIDEDVLKAAQGARGFANYAVGYDNIDVKKATEMGFMVTNTPGVLTEATAELAWALILACARRIIEADRFVRQGNFQGWAPLLFLGTEIEGKTLGIIGAGRIGTAVARKSRGFNMRLLYTDVRSNEVIEKESGAIKVELEVLLKESDFISIHAPLLLDTYHLISEREFGLMKKTAIVINTSRGPVVDEKALLKALKEGWLTYAGLDVFEHEPQIEPELLRLNNVVILPHIGSATTETRTRMAILAAQNLIAMVKGEVPPNLVNPEVLKKT